MDVRHASVIRLHSQRCNGHLFTVFKYFTNKAAQSNLERGSHRGAVAHVRPIGPCGQWHAQIRPKRTHSRKPIPKPHYLPHTWTRPTDDAKRHPDPIRRFSTMHWTDRPTDRPTDRLRESLMTIARSATNESDAA